MTSSIKISYVDPKTSQKDDYSDPKTGSTNQQNSYKSQFVSTGKDQWKALVDSTLDPTQDPTLDPASGLSIPSIINGLVDDINTADPESASTSTPISDMMDAINSVEQPPAFYGPIDEKSAGMVLVDPTQVNPLLSGMETPYVPNIYDLFKASPELQDDMQPVVDRYKVLVKTINMQLKNDYYFLKQPMSLMEKDALQKEVGVLKANRLQAKKFLEDSKHYLYLQKVREMKAALDEENS